MTDEPPFFAAADADGNDGEGVKSDPSVESVKEAEVVGATESAPVVSGEQQSTSAEKPVGEQYIEEQGMPNQAGNAYTAKRPRRGPPTGTRKGWTQKPADFDTRECCDAPMPGGEKCKNKRGQCKRHCGSWAGKKAHACANQPIQGMTRCKYHGGKTPCGLASKLTKSMIYSKHKIANITERYEEFLKDPELLSSRSEVALLQVRAEQLFARFSGAESGALFGSIQESWAAFREASQSGDPARLAAAGAALDSAIASGSSNERQWREWMDVARELSHHKSVEQRRQVDLKQLVSVEQVVMLVSLIVQSIHRHVHDRTALEMLQKDISAVVTLPDRTGGG